MDIPVCDVCWNEEDNKVTRAIEILGDIPLVMSGRALKGTALCVNHLENARKVLGLSDFKSGSKRIGRVKVGESNNTHNRSVDRSLPVMHPDGVTTFSTKQGGELLGIIYHKINYAKKKGKIAPVGRYGTNSMVFARADLIELGVKEGWLPPALGMHG